VNAAFHCCKLNETVLVDILIGKFMDDDIKLQSDTKIREFVWFFILHVGG